MPRLPRWPTTSSVTSRIGRSPRGRTRWTYRAGRFIRRHRVPVALAALVRDRARSPASPEPSRRPGARRSRRRARIAPRRSRARSAISRCVNCRAPRRSRISTRSSCPTRDRPARPSRVGALLARAERIVDRQQGETVENRVEMLMSIGSQYHEQTEDRERRARAHARVRSGLAAPRSIATRPRGLRAGRGAGAIGRSGTATEVLTGVDVDLPDEPHFALYRVICMLRQSEVARDRGETQAAIDGVLQARALNRSTVKSVVLEYDIAGHLGESYRIAGRMREADAAFRDTTAGLTVLGLDDTESAGTAVQQLGSRPRSPRAADRSGALRPPRDPHRQHRWRGDAASGRSCSTTSRACCAS